MKRTRLHLLRTRFSHQHGHKWRSWQTITRAARIAKWTREIETIDL